MPGSFAIIAAMLSMEEVPEHGSEKDRAAVERGFQLFSVLGPKRRQSSCLADFDKQK
jgi:hypothetical protein